EAPFDLVAGIPAGTWHLVGDGVITESVDVHFEVIHRRGSADTDACTWDHHFDPALDGTFPVQPLDADAACTAVDFQPGDKLVFKYSGASAMNNEAYIPDGEGSSNGGRDPNLT